MRTPVGELYMTASAGKSVDPRLVVDKAVSWHIFDVPVHQLLCIEFTEANGSWIETDTPHTWSHLQIKS